MAARDIMFIGVIITVFALSFVALHYSFNTIYDEVLNVTVWNESVGASDAARDSKELTNRFDYIVFVLFIALSFTLIITGWFVGGNAIFSFIYFLVIIVAIIVSAILNNVWARFAETTAFVAANTINNFPLTDALLSNLPLYVGIVGFLGIIVMFAKPAIMGGVER